MRKGKKQKREKEKNSRIQKKNGSKTTEKTS